MGGKWRASCVIGLLVAGWLTVVPPAWGDNGDILIEYDSAWARLPMHCGWQLDCRCPNTGCPNDEPACRYQGGLDASPADGELDNNCATGTGCAREDEHYNAPLNRAEIAACTYTEWLVFDDGEDWLADAYPALPPRRNLTIPGSYFGPHALPAFGANGFTGAPRHAPLRITVGSGTPAERALPADVGVFRNHGQLDLWHTFEPPAQSNAITLIARMAAGNRRRSDDMVQLCAFGRCFTVGVDGEPGSSTFGRFGGGLHDGLDYLLFGTATTRVALARPFVPGPHDGEFFQIRIVLRRAGTVAAWLNDDPARLWTGIAEPNDLQPDQVRLSPDFGSATMWLDFIRLLEGEVTPDFIGCNSPAADTNHDRVVDAADWANGLNGFIDCATGPAPAVSISTSLSPACRCLDVNGDAAIDLIDYAAFQRCLSADTLADPDVACGK